jgi:hypothetical protein
MSHDPATGPFTRQQINEMVAAPYGEATKLIRKVDPFWGREEGEKVRWRVNASGRLHGTAFVQAPSLKEADKLANELTALDFDWGSGSDDFDILNIELDKWD